VNGKPAALEATYTWKTLEDFERFMRFAERYAETNGLGFAKKSDEAAQAQNDEQD
jgi:photosystem II protein